MTRLPTFPVEGGCACGAVRYRLTKAPPFVYTCHCSDCQKLTTSAFTLSAPVARDTLEITQGTLKSWTRATTDSGPTRLRQLRGAYLFRTAPGARPRDPAPGHPGRHQLAATCRRHLDEERPALVHPHARHADLRQAAGRFCQGGGAMEGDHGRPPRVESAA